MADRVNGGHAQADGGRNQKTDILFASVIIHSHFCWGNSSIGTVYEHSVIGESYE